MHVTSASYSVLFSSLFCSAYTQSSGGARTELAAQVLEERAGPLRQRLALRDLRRERGR